MNVTLTLLHCLEILVIISSTSDASFRLQGQNAPAQQNNQCICNVQCRDATMRHHIIQIRIQRKYTVQDNVHWTKKASACLTRSDYVIKTDIIA